VRRGQLLSTLAGAVLVGILYFTVPELFRPPDAPSDREHAARRTTPHPPRPASRPAPPPPAEP
jgi:hypothetical protein